MKIRTLLDKKGRKVVTVKPDASLDDVVGALRQHHIGCVVISHDGKHVDGMVAVRDIAYAMAERRERLRTASGAEILDVPIHRIMSHEVYSCSEDDTLKSVMMQMASRHILHVPVLENGELRGIVSNDDVVRYAVEEMELEKNVLQESALVARTLEELR
jgi:CBS domain-containing protein